MNLPSSILSQVRLMKTVSISVALCTVFGCGGGEQMYSVRGTVTYGTEAVAEGTITFQNSESGTTAQAALSPEGKYSVRVAPGKYKIMVEPPMVTETRGSDAGQTYKKVDNIPNNFRISDKTTLNSNVSSDATLDFNLKK